MILLYIALPLMLILVNFMFADITRMIIFDTKSLQIARNSWKYVKWVMIIPPISIVFLVLFAFVMVISSLREGWTAYSKG